MNHASDCLARIVTAAMMSNRGRLDAKFLVPSIGSTTKANSASAIGLGYEIERRRFAANLCRGEIAESRRDLVSSRECEDFPDAVNVVETERHVVSSERSQIVDISTRETPYPKSLDESNPRHESAGVFSRLELEYEPAREASFASETEGSNPFPPPANLSQRRVQRLRANSPGFRGSEEVRSFQE